jgi:hypothetical protein
MRSRTVLLDPAYAYPEIGQVRIALAAQDWPAARAVLDAAAPALRTLVMRACTAEANEALLRSAAAANPDDAGAAAMLGMYLIDVGWSARTAARAAHVSREQFAAFHQWLRQAEAVLIDAAARHPRDPAIWTARLLTARGLDLDQGEKRRRYDRLRLADPQHFPGQTQYLQGICPKWGGTWEVLHAWARETAFAAPPGSVQGALVVQAHIERWLETPAATRAAYMTQPAVRASVDEAAAHSVLHPDFRPAPGWVAATSSFAMAFGLTGNHVGAARTLTMLGDLATEFPWQYLAGDTAENIRRHRDRALAATGGVL